ncbi:MAG: hypothetical protein ACRD10_11895, partial [Terriglobia bacterium]
MKLPFSVTASFTAVLVCASSCLPGYARGKTPRMALGAPGAARASGPALQPSPGAVTIPGPLRSFLRLAAISQEVSPDQVLPLLARNVAMEGYQGNRQRTKSLRRTEYLSLLQGYVKQARKLMVIAGPDGVIRIADCSQAQPLLTILGYRFMQPCGPDASIETADPKKAFLADDSGFPLTDLEQTLRGGKPFAYPYPSSQEPVLFNQADWLTADKNKNKRGDVIDAFFRNPALARLYWAMSRMDENTRSALLQSPGLKKLIPFGAVLNFYGAQLCIEEGRVVVPGGPAAEPAWKSLVGASPESPTAFIVHLVAKDDGWAAAYFDALSRISGAQQAYFTQPRRLRLFYEALRGRRASPGPARPVFRPDPGMLLLVTQLRLDGSGQPQIPGGLDVWKEIFEGERKSDSKTAREWAKRAPDWNNPDQLVAALFAVSRVSSGNGPLQLYLTLTAIDRERPSGQRLAPQTVQLLAEKFSQFGDQYPAFSEFYALNDVSITRFLTIAEDIDRIPDRALRDDALGIFQANAGLWRILARQGEIPVADWNVSWQRAADPFANVRSSAELFDAAQSSLGGLLRAASGRSRVSEDEIINMLAGPVQSDPAGQRVREDLAANIRSAMDAQRLVSLDTLFGLGDGLSQMARGKAAASGLLQLSGQLREFQLPQPLFTSGERAEWSFGLYNNRHIKAEMATDLGKVIKSPRSTEDLAAAKGQLVPFLRDTLVGLNYAYYAPPGAQMLYSNPLFVRSHDFSGEEITGSEQAWKTPSVFGRGQAASGGAHLIGSLADLPYVLAEVEQDFIVPENVQALVWEDLAATLLTNAVVPRWWRVTRNELHAVALYQQFGEELLAAAAKDEALRNRVVTLLSTVMLPQRSEIVSEALRAGRVEQALAELTPAQSFFVAGEFRRDFPQESKRWGKAGQELDNLSRRYPREVRWDRLSQDFGVPHPALAQTYDCDLLNVKPFPTFLGYSSRLLAESWQSDNLYWARLADENGYPPVMLNVLVPELTRRMVANIFASDLGDWPALLRALRET